MSLATQIDNNTVFIKNYISSNLFLRKSANYFFETIINHIKNKIVYVDFSNIESISHSFAHQYLTNKQNTTKTIKEINVPKNVSLILDLISESFERDKIK